MTTEIQRMPRYDPYNLIGVRLGDRYKVIEAYKGGGMGLVYKAVDTQLLDQSVAVKVLSSINEDRRAEFEGLALAKLQHPHIVGIRALGTTPNGLHYIVMDWVPGDLDLSNVPLSQAADYLDALAGALDYAHQNGVLHRDVKLSNVRLNSAGEPVLLDFGIAKLLDHDDGPTVYATNPSTLGTPYYKAPETWLEKPQFLPASDQYSLAVLVYQLVTGNLPFKVESSSGSIAGIVQWANAHMKVPPIPPGDYRKDLPPAAAAVILKALAKDPRNRFRNCTEFAKAFRHALMSTDPGTRSSKTVPLLLLTIAVLAVILIGGGFILFTGTNRTPTSGGFVIPITVSPSLPAIIVNSPEPPTVVAIKPNILPTTLSAVTRPTAIQTASPMPQVVAKIKTPAPTLRPPATSRMTASILPPTPTVTVISSSLPSDTPSPRPSATVTHTAQPSKVVSSSTPTSTSTIDIVATALAQTQTAINLATSVPLTVNALLTQTATFFTKTPTATPSVTLTPSVVITPTEVGGGGHKIVFSSNRDKHWQIYSMNLDGSNQVNLSNNDFDNDEPAWSPNGQRIVFMSKQSGHWQIYSMNVDGSNQVRLTQNDTSPTWSPDGTHIAFGSDRTGNSQIYVMNADGTNQTRVTHTQSTDNCPSWSPDGRKLVFRSDRDGNWQIYSMDVNGNNLIRLTYYKAFEDRPFYSPDGSQIVFHSTRGGADPIGAKVLIWNIYTMNHDGSNVQQLLNIPNAQTTGDPYWSPDGKHLVFFSDPKGNWEIAIYDLTNHNVEFLTTTTANNRYARWQP